MNSDASVSTATLTELPVWRLEIEVGRSGAMSIPPQPKYSFRLETDKGTKVFECDFATLDKLKKELEASAVMLRTSARLNGRKSTI